MEVSDCSATPLPRSKSLVEPEKSSMSPGLGRNSPPCLGSPHGTGSSGSGSSNVTSVENKGVAGDSSDSGTSMSLVSNGDNSGGSIPPLGPAFGGQQLVESVSGEIAEILGHLDQSTLLVGDGESEDSTASTLTSHSRQNGMQQVECVNSGSDQAVGAGVGGTVEGAVGGVVVSDSGPGATALPEAQGDSTAQGDMPNPPSLPPRTYREQPAPPLPPRKHRRDKDAPPLPPRNNTDKVHRKRQVAESVVPPERTHSLDLPPPPLPPRTYSPIHMSGGSQSPGTGVPGPQVTEGERSGGSSAEGFSTSVSCNNSHHHHHHHQNVDSPSTSNDSGNASREEDPSGLSWRPPLAGQQPQSRHSVAEVERTRGRDPLLAQNLGLTNHARERNSLPVLADHSPNLHVINADGGSGGITPPARPHPKLMRAGAVEPRPAPLVTSVSEQTPAPPHNHTAELRRLKVRSVDAVAQPEPGSTASIPPRLQPRARMLSEEERQQQWQQINQQLQIWTRRQIERADSPRQDGVSQCHVHDGGEERQVPCTECEADTLADVSSISVSASPSTVQSSQPAAIPSPHSPQAAVSPSDGSDGREGRVRTSVASSGGHGHHGHSREDSTPPPPVPASSRQAAGTSAQSHSRSSASGIGGCSSAGAFIVSVIIFAASVWSVWFSLLKKIKVFEVANF